MNERLKNVFYKGLTWCFFVLWVLVAVISMYHTWLFFMVGNPVWIAGIMSVAFEVGLALTLFSILTTDNNKSIVPWTLMVLLTVVQICGNVFSVFKFMIESHTATQAYTYINGSFLHWFVTGLPQTDVLSIIAIMLGAILPVVALFMTDMVANNFKLRNNSESKEKKDEADSRPIEQPDDAKFETIGKPAKEKPDKFVEVVRKDEVPKPETKTLDIDELNPDAVPDSSAPNSGEVQRPQIEIALKKWADKYHPKKPEDSKPQENESQKAEQPETEDDASVPQPEAKNKADPSSGKSPASKLELSKDINIEDFLKNNKDVQIVTTPPPTVNDPSNPYHFKTMKSNP